MITVNRESLAEALSLVSLVARKSWRSANAGLAASGGKLTAWCCGDAMSAWCEVECDGDILGPFLLDVSRLGRIASASSSEFVTLSELDGRVQIADQSGKSTLMCGASDPPSPPEIGDDTFTIDGDSFRSAINATKSFADPNSTRFALGGLQIEIANKASECRSTNARVAAWASLKAEGSPRQMLIPPEPAAIIAQRSKGTQIAGSSDSNAVVLQCSGARIKASQLDGRFPNLRLLDKFERGLSFSIHAGTLLAAIDRLLVTTDDPESHEAGGRCVDFCVADGELRLTSSAAEIGEGEQRIPIAVESGDQFDQSVSGRFLRQVVSTHPAAETLTFEAVDGGKLLFSSERQRHMLQPFIKPEGIGTK